MHIELMEGDESILFDTSEKTADVLADDGQTLELQISTATGEVLLHLSRGPCEFDIDELRTELQRRRLERRGEPQSKFSAEKFTRRLLQLEQEQPA